MVKFILLQWTGKYLLYIDCEVLAAVVRERMCMALCFLNRLYGQRVCVSVVAQAGRANKCLSDHLGRDLYY